MENLLDRMIRMDLTRKQKLLLSSSMSMLGQVISLVTGFILPKLFLTYFGSAVNGLVASITQFLGFITLCEMGVGAVVQSALYKPLADHDTQMISKIVISSERFFRRIALALLVYTAGLMAFYPVIVQNQFTHLFTATLIAVIALNSMSQYYFSMTYRLLLNADQLAFLQIGTNSILLIVNAAFSILLMTHGASVHAVKLTTTLLFLLQPLFLSWYVKKRYRIDRTLVFTEEPIQQKWNGLAQHIATVVLMDTDAIVLTLFSTLENVSIYSVYHLIVNGLRKIINSLTTGMQAMLGNMLAKEQMDVLRDTFDSYEWFTHTVAVVVFGLAGLLILPFVSVYTRNITDTNYMIPEFAVLITAAQASFCLRGPYNLMVLAAGHYKQTQWSAIIEAAINIVISVASVFWFGLIGVALGTLAAMVYRSIYLAYYVSKHILPRGIWLFWKHLLVDSLCIGLNVLAVNALPFFSLQELSYGAWVVLACKTAIIVIPIDYAVNLLFYKQEMDKGIKFVLKKKGGIKT